MILSRPAPGVGSRTAPSGSAGNPRCGGSAITIYALPAIPYLRLRCELVAEEPARLPPFKGSMLRGAFGHALRTGVCTMGPRQPCEPCPLRPGCVYPRLFETFVDSEPPPFLRGLPTGPRPYIFEPRGEAAERLEYAPGDRLPFDLLLLGQAVELQGWAVRALERMAPAGLGKGRRRFRLESVACEDASGVWRAGYLAGEQTWQELVPARRPEVGLPAGERVELRFHTPTRLRVRGRVSDHFDFRDLAFHMLRRVLELAHFHVPGAEIDWQLRPLLERCCGARIVRRELRWLDWERWSNRQQSSMRLGGVVGRLVVEGDLEPFAALLATAQVVHVGKGAVFGLRRMEVGPP